MRHDYMCEMGAYLRHGNPPECGCAGRAYSRDSLAADEHPQYQFIPLPYCEDPDLDFD